MIYLFNLKIKMYLVSEDNYVNKLYHRCLTKTNTNNTLDKIQLLKKTGNFNELNDYLLLYDFDP